MADILSQYGSDSSQPQEARASKGGACMPKSLPYSPPKGPTSQMQNGPGLHGTNHGNGGTQRK